MSLRNRVSEKWFSTYAAAIEQQTALRVWLQSDTWTHFVTISFNEAVTNASARRLLSRFHQQLDQKLFGRRFFKRPDELRTFFVAIPEIASSLHFHALFRVPAEKHELFVHHASAVLKQVAKAATFDVRPIGSIEHQERIVSYITKDAYTNQSSENFIVSSEFHRRPKIVTSTDHIESEPAFSTR